MRVALEPMVPYDRSVRWRIHDAYYAGCGRRAWDDGTIPSFASSNAAIAAQHARLLVALSREGGLSKALGGRAPVQVLEVGGGSGMFAANFLRSLERDCGRDGRSLAGRVRYVFTDCSRRSLEEAVGSPGLRDEAARGRLVPALLDLRAQDARPAAVDGGPMEGPFALVVANYVACTIPPKMIRKDGDRLLERWVRAEAEADAPKPARALVAELVARAVEPGVLSRVSLATEWRELDPDAPLPDPVHAATLLEALGPFRFATVPYPQAFLDFLRRIGRHMLRGGVALVSDYGSTQIVAAPDDDDLEGQSYGNTVNHGVEFALFDSFCAAAGLSVQRTRDPLRMVHTAAVRYARRPSRAFARAFEQTHQEASSGEDMLDLNRAAGLLYDRGQYRAAARLYRRCAELDPSSAEFRWRSAVACRKAGWAEAALDLLREGEALDEGRWFDFQFQMGLAFATLGRYGEAIGAFVRSLMRGPNPETWANLGVIYETIGDREQARDAYHRALALQRGHPLARQRLAGLRRRRGEPG